jgi:hypothetical protein
MFRRTQPDSIFLKTDIQSKYWYQTTRCYNTEDHNTNKPVLRSPHSNRSSSKSLSCKRIENYVHYKL